MSGRIVITGKTTIAEAIRICPSAPDIFMKHGMGCFGCLAAAAETIEEGVGMHNIDAQEIVDELNAACASNEPA